MNDTDTSDEAFERWWTSLGVITVSEGQCLSRFQECWNEAIGLGCEAVRRCEARMEELRKEIEDLEVGFKHHKEGSKQWKQAYQKLKAEMEEERRKAFEAGWKSGWNNHSNGWLHTEQDDYSAFKEGQK